MKYKVGSKIPSSRFLNIEIIAETPPGKALNLALPKWRPGRYELANFAKNIRGFRVTNLHGSALNFNKTSSHVWSIPFQEETSVKIEYECYTTELNAGSSWVDDEQLYLNPINCLLYKKEGNNEECTLELLVPENFRIATSLHAIEPKVFLAKNFQELVDAPIIASPTLQHETYEVAGTKFHLWFQGECRPNFNQLLPDFTAFTKKQLEAMGSFPFAAYHFLFQILPYKAYHGVEHLSSTVVSLGPGYEIMNEHLYRELLGVSSHELFHAWNVKSIRPAEMLPYNFQTENYSEMGYLTEGVTTYCGDLFLVQSELYSENQYLAELHKLMDRHSLNYGRFNYSVCESSFDTWLDGYAKGIPNRKTSIYTEGALLALCIDLMIIKNSDAKKSLNDVMKNLFENQAKKQIGITEDIFIETIKTNHGHEIEALFSNYYHQASDYFELLKEYFIHVGFTLNKEEHPNFLARQLGCYTDNTSTVQLVAPDSPAYCAGIVVGDKITSINGVSVQENANEWANYFNSSLTIGLRKTLKKISINLQPNASNFFSKYRLTKNEKLTEFQQKNYRKWLNKN